MSPATVIRMDRARRVNRVMATRRRHLQDSEPRPQPSRGRIWLNGSELGEARATLAHLAENYD